VLIWKTFGSERAGRKQVVLGEMRVPRGSFGHTFGASVSTVFFFLHSKHHYKITFNFVIIITYISCPHTIIMKKIMTFHTSNSFDKFILKN